MSFSSVRFEERHGKGNPRGKALVPFLGYFFVEQQRSNIRTGTARREAVRASVGESMETIQACPTERVGRGPRACGSTYGRAHNHPHLVNKYFQIKFLKRVWEKLLSRSFSQQNKGDNNHERI